MTSTILTHPSPPVTGGGEPDPEHDRTGAPGPVRPHPGHTGRPHLTAAPAPGDSDPDPDEALRRARSGHRAAPVAPAA